MTIFNMITNSAKETQHLGEKIAGLMKPGSVIALTGELGSGKTTFTKGLARGLGVPDPEYVNSPSFVLAREYKGRINLYHFDLYRLDNLHDIEYIGIQEYLNGDGVVVIEWAEKGLPIVPRDNLLITIRYTSAAKRERSVSLKPQGQRYRELIEQLKIREGIMALRRSRLTR